MRWLGAIVYDLGRRWKTEIDVFEMEVMVGCREICGLGTLGVTASLAPIANRIFCPRIEDATASMTAFTLVRSRH